MITLATEADIVIPTWVMWSLLGMVIAAILVGAGVLGWRWTR
jgi:hypothetical protein